MSVPPVSSSSQVPDFQLMSRLPPCRRPRPWRLTLLLATLAPLLVFLSVTVSETLSRLKHLIDGPQGRAEGISVIPVDWNHFGNPVTQASDFPRDGEVIIPRRTPTVDPRPYRRHGRSSGCDTVTPLHTYGWGIRCTGLTWNAVCFPVFGNLSYVYPLDKLTPLRPPEVYNYYIWSQVVLCYVWCWFKFLIKLLISWSEKTADLPDNNNQVKTGLPFSMLAPNVHFRFLVNLVKLLVVFFLFWRQFELHKNKLLSWQIWLSGIPLVGRRGVESGAVWRKCPGSNRNFARNTPLSSSIWTTAHITGSAVAQHCVKAHMQSQWRKSKFDPL